MREKPPENGIKKPQNGLEINQIKENVGAKSSTSLTHERLTAKITPEFK